MARRKKFLTKPRLAVLSGLFQNLSATWIAIILISPGLGSVKNFADVLRLLIVNLSWGILFLVIAMKLEEKSR